MLSAFCNARSNMSQPQQVCTEQSAQVERIEVPISLTKALGTVQRMVLGMVSTQEFQPTKFLPKCRMPLLRISTVSEATSLGAADAE